jgi:hypothetical protein
LNSLIIILGFSEVLQPLGIAYNFHPNDASSVVWGVAIIRSLWVGKFTIVDGFLRILRSGRAGGNEDQGGILRPSAPSPGSAVEADSDRPGAGHQRDRRRGEVAPRAHFIERMD